MSFFHVHISYFALISEMSNFTVPELMGIPDVEIPPLEKFSGLLKIERIGRS
jgi:hypothetical protein